MLQLDHIAISAASLDEGVAFVEALFGVPMSPGGQHAAMGTHNRLLSLGPDLYLEVIAIDPKGRDPGRPRWFNLDQFSGPPRLTNWILRADTMDEGLSLLPCGTGDVLSLARGDLRWQMAVPETGLLPLDGFGPALLAWGDGCIHPAQRLPDQGVRLLELDVSHPDIDVLPQIDGELVTLSAAPPRVRARFATPSGEVVL